MRRDEPAWVVADDVHVGEAGQANGLEREDERRGSRDARCRRDHRRKRRGHCLGARKCSADPAGNTHASAPIALTVLLVSLRSEAVSPLNTSVIAKTSAAASVATTNLRRRHTRSRKPTNHIAVSPHVADQPT